MFEYSTVEPEFCNVASGWEKRIVEKNVQEDGRRQIWQEAVETRRSDPGAQRSARQTMPHGVAGDQTSGVAGTDRGSELLLDELPKLMHCRKPFDGYVEHPARVSSTL